MHPPGAFNMTLAGTVLAVLLLTTCAQPSPPRDPEGWHREQFGEVLSFAHPARFARTEVIGVDSLVAGYKSAGVLIILDYGKYARELQPSSPQVRSRGSEIIDGRELRWTIGDYDPNQFPPREVAGEPYTLTLRALFPQVHGRRSRDGETISLNIDAACITSSDCQTVLEMVRSVRFSPEERRRSPTPAARAADPRHRE